MSLLQLAQAQHEHHMPMTDSAKKTAVTKKPAAKPAPKKTTAKKPAAKRSTQLPAKPAKVTTDTIPAMDHLHHMVADSIPVKDTSAMMMDHHHMVNMDTTKMGEESMIHDMDHDMENMNMSHVFSLNLPMSRNGSGTGWLPDASPMYGYMLHTDKWMWMLHGNLFLRYNNQDFTNKGSRGDAQVDAPNWIMFMGQRRIGSKGLFHFSTMFSLDAVVTGKRGYPLLFQTGETANGEALVDRQHPHDLFSELSVGYSYALSKKADVFAYLGYPAEPALGPVAFMHRPSALDNPDAPLSHHWTDATHITFGVATIGLRYMNWKLDASSFTGREPDENRYDLDRPRFDSWSGRISFNPSDNWALQVSRAFIKSPEALHPQDDINRTTASVIFSQAFSNRRHLDITTVWGANKAKDHAAENAWLLEGTWKKIRLTWYGRYELVQKSTEELELDPLVYGPDVLFNINAFTAGINYDLTPLSLSKLAVGGQFTCYHAPDKLNSLYGKSPMAFEVYLRFYPGLMK